ncbi:hypothetical protein AB0B85_10965 [Micromonospora sp. NPDC049044]|uniref:hypothetical protein n=1 Tax=Micromonospora sp. NPDC049044 TaxID=3154827 RepID=UPI0033FD9796
MRDENLVGLWDSGPYDYGAMESSWVCLRTDGTGWSAWANAAGGTSVSQLTWTCVEAGEVELRYRWTASGTGRPGTPPELVAIDEEGPDDTLVRTRFAVRPDTPPLAESPVATLHLDEAVEFSRHFALVAPGPE